MSFLTMEQLAQKLKDWNDTLTEQQREARRTYRQRMTDDPAFGKEIGGQLQQFFARADADRDGLLSQHEFKDFFRDLKAMNDEKQIPAPDATDEELLQVHSAYNSLTADTEGVSFTDFCAGSAMLRNMVIELMGR